ncbi:ketoacyl-ACP synthase III [Acetivibrio cellulolyticus]|uniref:ketoacyl-ACP synthase III n=1 Tax=Acetivibrio cellulolyticus TaxID=35830 RepID=UPI0001E2EBF3|nr:ketoacyl-ACP synthase III [Acetivibrio cellulolyticus]
MEIDIQFPDIKPLNVKRQAKIISMGVGLPERVVSNQEIIDKYNIIATDRAVKFSIGISERRWINSDESLEGLMAKAVRQCLNKAEISIEQVDKVIYTKLLGDYQIPALSVALLKELGTTVGIPAFDISSACSGFMHAMDLAVRSIASGDEYVLVIGGGTSSKGIQRWNKPNPKTIFLYGDGITAMLLGRSDTKHFISSYIFTNPVFYNIAYIPYGTSTLRDGIKEIDYNMFDMRIDNGNLIMESSVEHAKVVCEKLLMDAGLTLNDIDFFVTSDQSTVIWEAQLKALNIPKEKSISCFHKYGNTVASMSPLNLYELIETGRLKRGNIVMMHGHGAGASSGGFIFKY